jgi:hypothetical protein
VALLRTDVPDERIASVIRVTRVDVLGSKLSILRSMLRLLVTADIFTSSLILVTVMQEAKRSSEMSVFTRTTQCHIQEDDIL